MSLAPSQDEVERAKAAAFRYLTPCARTRQEVVERLTTKGFSPQVVAAVVETLERLGLLDDLDFARQWVETRGRRRPMGRYRLSRELLEHGVPEGVVRQALDEAFAGVDPVDRAVDLLRQRLDRYRGLDEVRALRRMVGFLTGRGFDGETATEAARRVWCEVESFTAESAENTERAK